MGRYAPAIADLTDAIRLEQYPGPYRLRAGLGRWAEAEADYAEAIRRGWGHHDAWHEAGILRLRAGDAAGYRAVARRALALLRAEKDHDAACTLVNACVLSPDAGIDPGNCIHWRRHGWAAPRGRLPAGAGRRRLPRRRRQDGGRKPGGVVEGVGR